MREGGEGEQLGIELRQNASISLSGALPSDAVGQKCSNKGNSRRIKINGLYKFFFLPADWGDMPPERHENKRQRLRVRRPKKYLGFWSVGTVGSPGKMPSIGYFLATSRNQSNLYIDRMGRVGTIKNTSPYFVPQEIADWTPEIHLRPLRLVLSTRTIVDRVKSPQYCSMV